MATVYISPTGDDSRTYVQAQSRSTPWATVGKAETSATTGDTVVLLAGTHTWVSATFTKSFTITGDTTDPSLYIVDAGNNARYWNLPGTSTIQYLKLYRNHMTSSSYWIAGTAGTTLTVQNCWFDDCKISGFTGSGQGGGFLKTGAAGTFTVQNNLFTNILRNNFSMFALVRGETATSTTFVVKGNTFVNTSAASQISHFIDGAGTGNTWTLKNNILYNSGGTIATTYSGTGVTQSYSDLYGTWTGTTSGTGVITSDPLFVDMSNANYNLRPASPCIDAGTAT
jgi:hypothetical protein